MNSCEILVALAVKYQGDWESIYNALHSNEEEDLERYLEEAIQSDYKYVTILSEEYPELLKKQYMPPFVLFYHGDISLLQNIDKNVAVVGSRQSTEYGDYMTAKIVETVSKEYNIVSGMALGIDAVAHRTALKNDGRTIAVLGGGINYIYPKSNSDIYYKAKSNHLVISEYPGSTMPKQENFPRRNRIIAMISRGTIVTEANAHSGTLTTVMFTLQCNRLLLCVPYLATAHSECNRLIAEGAYLIEDGEQALEILKNDIHI